MNLSRISFLKEGVVINPFVELVPARNWAERAAAGLPPSLFYSVKGDVIVGDDVVRVEINIAATDEQGVLKALGLEREDRNGNTLVVLANEPKGHAIMLVSAQDANGRTVPVIQDGHPVALNPAQVPAGWPVEACCKFRVNSDGQKALKVTNLRLAYDEATTAGGHACAKGQIESFAVVAAPPRVAAAGAPVAFGKIGSAPAYQAAARRTAVAAPAPAAY
jgi:hypothetical protein